MIKVAERLTAFGQCVTVRAKGKLEEDPDIWINVASQSSVARYFNH